MDENWLSGSPAATTGCNGWADSLQGKRVGHGWEKVINLTGGGLRGGRPGCCLLGPTLRRQQEMEARWPSSLLPPCAFHRCVLRKVSMEEAVFFSTIDWISCLLWSYRRHEAMSVAQMATMSWPMKGGSRKTEIPHAPHIVDLIICLSTPLF